MLPILLNKMAVLIRTKMKMIWSHETWGSTSWSKTCTSHPTAKGKPACSTLSRNLQSINSL